MTEFVDFLGGTEIKTSEGVPEFGNPDAMPDYEARLAAMTAHHIDLSLLDLTVQERVVFGVGRYLICHPNNLAAIRKALR